MMKWLWLLAVVSGLTEVRSYLYLQKAKYTVAKYTEAEGREFMEKLNKKYAVWQNRISNAQWNYDSNLTGYNLQIQLKLGAEFAAFEKEQWEKVIKYPYDKFKDPSLKRQFELHSTLGTAALPPAKKNRLSEVVAKMSDIYATTKLIEFKDNSNGGNDQNANLPKPTVALDPDLNDMFINYANDSCKLSYYWEGWHSSVGRKVKHLFEEYVKLSNEAARLNNFTDNAEFWIENFEMEKFDLAMHKLYQQILPFYQQLHAFVRRQLIKQHNTKDRKLIEPGGSLPAHILGSVWAQEWQNIYNLTVPYPGKRSADVTPTMKAKKYTPLKMFKMAEEFYTSINLSAMTDTFWKKTIMSRVPGVDMVCHASAWDFHNADDYRIKMCTRVSLEDFKVIHHEMGHVEYYMQYKDQPDVFREGANSGFHEAIGDTISLSVSTAKHLIKVGLLDPKTYVEDKEAEINSLYLMALEKVAFLPYAYGLDFWRWEIFRKKVTTEQYNCRFWQIRQQLQGIVPPVDRSADDFDGGAKYHVIADNPYISYFVSFIIQFQFHKALCIKAGQYNPKDPASPPLHHCDIYQSKPAGNLFKKMLSLGSSKPPQEAMKVITGQKHMDAGPLLDYFKPLYDWLIYENLRAGEKIGWSSSSKIECSHSGEVKIRRDTKIDKKCRYTFP